MPYPKLIREYDTPVHGDAHGLLVELPSGEVFAFGPYREEAHAEEAADYVRRYEEADGVPEEERARCRLCTWKHPGTLHMFVAL